MEPIRATPHETITILVDMMRQFGHGAPEVDSMLQLIKEIAFMDQVRIRRGKPSSINSQLERDHFAPGVKGDFDYQNSLAINERLDEILDSRKARLALTDPTTTYYTPGSNAIN